MPIPVTLLVGFLGSGKTTLLNRLLQSGEAGRALVIVNEFGDVGLDGALLASSSDGLVELPGGCLCCTISGDLLGTLEDLLAKRRRWLRPLRFDRILIEGSGLATPGPILRTLLMERTLAEELQPTGVVVAAQAPTLAEQLAAHPEVSEQLALADLVVLTHGDRAPGSVEGAMDLARSAAPGARIQRSDSDGFDPIDLLAPAPSAVELLERLSASAHQHDGSCGHAHTQGVLAWAFESEGAVDLRALDIWLRFLCSRPKANAHGGPEPQVLRLKGLVRTPEGRWAEVQGVGEWLEATPFSGATGSRSRLVLIGVGLDAGELERGWSSTLVGTG